MTEIYQNANDDPTPAAYARIVQPTAAKAALTSSSYLRLGSYVTDETTALPTGLTTTTSTVSQGTAGAKQQAEDAKTNAKKDPSKVYSATSQSATSYTTTPSDPIASSNNGVLIYSSADFHSNIVGAALEKFGKGHNVQVDGADAKYAVTAGKLDISALNGIFIKAGTVNSTTYAVEQAANYEVTASGYIKQTAYGPLDEITYGVTRKTFHGDAYDTFKGFKESTFHGRSHSYNMAGIMTMVLSGELHLRLSTRFSLTMSLDVAIFLGGEAKVILGGKADAIIGGEVKFIVGGSAKIGVGPDFKSMTLDTKILQTMDQKIAPVADAKRVGLNVTLCDFDFKKQMIKADDTFATFMKEKLEAKYANVTAEGKGTFASIDGLRSFL